MTRQQNRRAGLTTSDVRLEVAVALVRYQALAARRVESMGNAVMRSRNIVLKSKERLAMLGMHQDRRWK